MQAENATNYELTFYVAAEDAAPVRALVVKHGGAVLSERQLQKVHFGYPIAKQQFAFLGVISFSADPSVIAALQNDLTLSGTAIRFQIGRKVERKERKPMPAEDAKPSADGTRAPSRIKPFDATLSNEALEKKIEEILK